MRAIEKGEGKFCSHPCFLPFRILLSSVANFAGGMKLRIGKLSGVNDPVFGTLENYGAYLQRLYATQQVNISGTLTAGDENGFGW